MIHRIQKYRCIFQQGMQRCEDNYNDDDVDDNDYSDGKNT